MEELKKSKILLNKNKLIIAYTNIKILNLNNNTTTILENTINNCVINNIKVLPNDDIITSFNRGGNCLTVWRVSVSVPVPRSRNPFP